MCLQREEGGGELYMLRGREGGRESGAGDRKLKLLLLFFHSMVLYILQYSTLHGNHQIIIHLWCLPEF